MDEQQEDRLEDRKEFDKWIKGDLTGFSALYGKYRTRVFSFLLRMTSDRDLAEDLLQETFLAALRNANQFDRNRSFLSWVFGIAHKRTIDYFRHAKVEREHQDQAEKSVGTRIETQEQFRSNNDLRAMIKEAIEKLDPLQREVFLMREMGGIAFKDIARIMNCPINTALGRMRLALKNIRIELEKRGIHAMQ
jgi:RNA polymerase sigma-70 factor (ECF subfamily)